MNALYTKKSAPSAINPATGLKPSVNMDSLRQEIELKKDTAAPINLQKDMTDGGLIDKILGDKNGFEFGKKGVTPSGYIEKSPDGNCVISYSSWWVDPEGKRKAEYRSETFSYKPSPNGKTYTFKIGTTQTFGITMNANRGRDVLKIFEDAKKEKDKPND